MECELSQVVGVVARFVARTRGVAPESVLPTTRLLQEGLVDSFGLVELIADLQASLGGTLEDGALLPEDFDSPETLFARLRQL
jgi:acyl carrier protein